jgi:Tol biopolymer transport system component
MNKNLFDQIPAEEQPVASKLTSLVEEMRPSESFQWELENQLMDKATKTQPAQSWVKRIIVPVGWGIAAIIGILLLNGVFRSLAAQVTPATETTETQEASFAEQVRTGDICMGPLALEHGFSVFLTNPEKTSFVEVDAGNTIGELRSFTWSPDGERLALVGNTTGSGNIHIIDPTGGEIDYLLSGSEVGYLMDAAWSRDGKKLVMWSSQNNRVLYVLSADGTGLVEKRLGNTQLLGTSQFWPDGSSVVFYGATSTSIGLFELLLTDSEPVLINASVENGSSYTFSPDGSKLAYMEYSRDLGEARLFTEDLKTRESLVIGSLAIPKVPGASLPETANLSWSVDGKHLVFDFGRHAADRAVYLAKADGTGMIKVVDTAYAPGISADGRCLAYISDRQVFLLDLAEVAANPAMPTPILLADLPTGRGTPDTKLDKLQWSPAMTP